MSYNKREAKKRRQDAFESDYERASGHSRDWVGGYASPGDTNRAMASQSHFRQWIEGLPARVYNDLWDQACKKHRNAKGVTNMAAANKEMEFLKREYKEKQQALATKKKEQKERRQAAKAAVRHPAFDLPEIEEVMDTVEDEAKVEIPLVDEWEQLMDDEFKNSIFGPEGSVEANVGAVMTREDEEYQFTTPPGHPVLATSRALMAYQLRKEGLKKCAENPIPGSCVFEIGSGATGLKGALKFINKFTESNRVYLHCSFPVAGCDDLTRDVLLTGRSKFATAICDNVNWVDRTGRPVYNKVNACSHLARDCDCMRHYTRVHCFSTHASYYFEDADWRQIFKYTDDIRIGAHFPENEHQIVPSDTMEARWDKLSLPQKTMYGFGKFAKMAYESLFENKDHYAFTPLQEHGTTYVHPDPTTDIKRGGWHMPDLDPVTKWCTETTMGRVVTAASLTAAVVCAPNWISRLVRRNNVASTVATSLAVTMPLWLTMDKVIQRNGINPPRSGYTVRVVPGYSYVRKNETICSVYQLRRSPLSTLEPRSMTSIHADKARAREIAASMALSNNAEKAKKSAVAMGFRAGLTPAGVRDTVAAAEAYNAMATEPKNGLAPAPTPTRQGFARESFAWAIRRAPVVTLAGAHVASALGVAALSNTAATAAFSAVSPLYTQIGTPEWLRIDTAALRGIFQSSDAARHYWEQFLRTQRLSPIALTWLSALSSSATARLPQTPLPVLALGTSAT
jgi:hypothetical protein